MKFLVKKSSINGNGCFAKEFIKKGEEICFMEGKKLDIDQVKKLYDNNEERVGDPLQVSQKEYLDLDKPFLYFNHSCKPNSAIVGYNKLIAIKDINVDEEICFDYSVTVNDIDWGEDYVDWDMICFCLSDECRGIVEAFYKLDENLRNFYISNKYIQDYVLDINFNSKGI